MGYRFKPGEALDTGTRRILAEQLKRATAAIDAASDTAIAVHEARKAMKRCRALLRLVRPALEDRIFKTENQRFRDIGRALSEARDADVMLETVYRLAAVAEPDTAHVCQKLAARVSSRVAEHAVSATPDMQMEMRMRLATAFAAAEALEFSSPKMKYALRGLMRCYARGQRQFDANPFDANPLDDKEDHEPNTDAAATTLHTLVDDTPAHEWRKSVQLHWRHAQLLRNAWPAYFQMRIAETKALSDCLGAINDMATLKQFLNTDGRETLSIDERELILGLLHAERERHLEYAVPQGDRIFALKPKALGRSYMFYWSTAAAVGPPMAFTDPAPNA